MKRDSKGRFVSSKKRSGPAKKKKRTSKKRATAPRRRAWRPTINQLKELSTNYKTSAAPSSAGPSGWEYS